MRYGFKEAAFLRQKKKHEKSGGRIFQPSVRLCSISPSAALLRRSLLQEVGLFREDFPVCEDYEMWLRISSRYAVGFVSEPLIKKHGGRSDQLSASHKAMDYWRVLALRPFLKSPHITAEERRCVQETLRAKCRILLKGYEKHGNFQNQAEVLNILQEAEPAATGG